MSIEASINKESHLLLAKIHTFSFYKRFPLIFTHFSPSLLRYHNFTRFDVQPNIYTKYLNILFAYYLANKKSISIYIEKEAQ